MLGGNIVTYILIHIPTYIYTLTYSHHTAMVMELQDTVAELRRELALLKEQAEEREAEQPVCTHYSLSAVNVCHIELSLQD